MNSSLETLIYADLFDYPLTKEEVFNFLIGLNRHPRSGRESVPDKLRILNSASRRIQHDGKYYFLAGREQIVGLRKKREIWSREKLKIAQRVNRWLKIIPWVKMVGITGSLAMNNSDKNDDIDLLIISSKNRIWLTRLFSTIIVEMLGLRRHPLTKFRDRGILSINHDQKTNNFRDKICLNMFLDEEHLAVVSKERDLFTAHEVCQLKLLWERDGIYNKFLKENEWVKNYLPNAIVVPMNSPQPSLKKRGSQLVEPSPFRRGQGEVIMNKIETLARNFQLWYMKSRRTTEVISPGVIRFHPQDLRKRVLTRFEDSLKIALIKKE